MTNDVKSHSGGKLYISTASQNSDLDIAGFEARTWIEVKQVGSVGEYGVNTNILQYDTWDTTVAQKAKGITNAGDPDIECARLDSDPGQDAMRTAGDPEYYDAHAFKVVKQDGHIDYLRGLVTGPRSPNGS